jgi:hypothetical protein
MRNDYADILSSMENQRVIHVMHDWNVCEIDEVDTEHIADAYNQMKSIYDAWEEGEISRAYTIDMSGVQLCSNGSFDDGAYFTTDGKYVIAVLNGQIISAFYDNGKTTVIRIGSQEYDYADYV